MKELKEFVAREAKWSSMFRGSMVVSLDTHANRQRVADRIDSQLSPENLSCDGELSYNETNRRYRFLTKCAEQLLKLDPKVKFYEYA
jgi:hypothetical protein